MSVFETESSIEIKVCNKAFGLGVRGIKLNIKSSTGWPDRMFLIPGGRPLFIEFKKPGEKPTKKQLHIHTLLRELGYQVEVHDDATTAVQAIAKALEAARLSEKSCKVPN
jgi:uncharacterized protein YyaL (SSP411 family)